MIIASFPFIYNEHGTPHDYRRISIHGATKLWPEHEVNMLERQGGIGSTLSILWLSWFDSTMNNRFSARLLKAPLLPVWIIITFLVNVLGLLFDRIDPTKTFYNNVLIVLKKKLSEEITR